MNILLVCHEFSVTGAPNSLLRQACYFRDAGHNVDIFSLKDGNLKERYIEEGFNPIVVGTSYSEIKDAYYNQNKKYDFILCNTTVTYKAVDFLQHQKTPVVWFIRETRLVDKGMIEDTYFADVFKKFYNIYTVSDYAANVCKKYNKNVRIINNAVADNFKKFKPVTNKIVFGFIGQIAREKGVKFLFDAFNKLVHENPETELHIAGNFNHEFAKQLQNMNVPNVKWIGEVQKQDKENFFDNIDVLVVPSLDEPSGLTVIEGAMYGKPVITTDKTGANYIVKNEKSGFIVKTADTEDLYESMKKILNCNLVSMQKKSRKMYLKYGTTDKERKSVLKMLKQNKKNFPVIRRIDLEKCRQELCEWYKKRTKQELNLDNPQTFNEKIQWLKLYDSTPIKTRLADKYLVREWVKRKIGEKYLTKIYGVYDSFDEIDFDKLPNQFVIKCNHGAGYNIIVTDKSVLDLNDAKQRINEWMSENFAFKNGCELHYANIEHKIIIEELIKNKSGNDLNDYKFYCFNGDVKYIQVISERRENNHKVSFYDKNWKKQDWWDNIRYDGDVEKPKQLNKMVKIARKLCKGFNFVRVDLYYLDTGEVYFGEMTFTPNSGIMKWNPEYINFYFGKLFKLPIREYDIENGKYRPTTRDIEYDVKLPIVQYTKHHNKTKLNIFGIQVLKIKRNEIDYIFYMFGLQIYKRHISNAFAKINLFGIRIFKYKI